MDLNLNAEQEAVRDAIRGMLLDRSPLTRVRQVMMEDVPLDAELWRGAGELGWFGLAIPEDKGGAGYAAPEAMILFTELGRSLASGPWLGTVLGAHALADAGHEALAAVLAGERRLALVDDPRDALGTSDTISGTAAGVFDAGVAHDLLVLGGTTVRVIAADATGVTIDERPCMDPTRRMAKVTFAGARATRLASDATALRLLGAVLAAAEAVGVSECALAMSVEYAKVRQQFGRPIGTFQAIKHRCADMAVRTEVARAATYVASVAVRDGEPDPAFQTRVAKTLATEAALVSTADNVQNHGGMGYTWEADAHLYLKRARILEHVLGSRTTHLDAIVAGWRAA